MTLHFPQVPLPPQDDVRKIPASFRDWRIDVPDDEEIVSPDVRVMIIENEKIKN